MSDNYADISIVVPAHNPGTLILECLSSLLEQDYPSGRREIIVVDDGSSEDVKRMVSCHFPDVFYMRRSENGGCDAARQDGITAASGQVIAHTDADCVVSPVWLQSINDDIQAGSCAVTGPVIHKQSLIAQTVAITQFGHSQLRKRGYTTTFPGCNFAVKSDLIEEFGYRNPELRDGADRLLAWKLINAGCKITYNPCMFVRHFPPLSARTILRRYKYYSEVTWRLRKLEPRLPGGNYVSLGPLAPVLWAGARLGRDYQRLAQLMIQGHISLHLVPLIACIFPTLRLIDAVGMLSVYRSSTRSAEERYPSLLR